MTHLAGGSVEESEEIMSFEFTWIEVVIVSGLILLALGPERLLEFRDDVSKLWADIRAIFQRRKV